MDDLDPRTATQRISRSALRPLERFVALGILAHWSKASPKPWPSIAALQDWTGLGRRTVIDAIKGLVAAGAVRIDCKRPMREVDGRREVIRNAKPTNHYDLSGLMGLPMREAHQCTSDTSAGGAPVRERTDTSAGAAPELVQEPHPNSSRKTSKKGSSTQVGAPDPKIQEVLEHWRTVLWSRHHSKAPKLSPGRCSPVRARLRDGKSVDELKRVIDAVARSPWHNGDNPNGVPYIEPKTIFAPDKVDRWLATKAPVRTRVAPPQMGLADSYREGTL